MAPEPGAVMLWHLVLSALGSPRERKSTGGYVFIATLLPSPASSSWVLPLENLGHKRGGASIVTLRFHSCLHLGVFIFSPISTSFVLAIFLALDQTPLVNMSFSTWPHQKCLLVIGIAWLSLIKPSALSRTLNYGSLGQWLRKKVKDAALKGYSLVANHMLCAQNVNPLIVP